MSVPEKVDNPAELADAAIARMAALEIPPTPENFTVWYAYLGGIDPDLEHMIQRLLDTGEDFSEKQCSELYLRYMATAGDGHDDVRETAFLDASADLGKSVETVMTILDEAGAGAERYGEALANVDGALLGDEDSGQVRQIVSDLLSETKRMAQQNQKVNARLQQSNEEIAELQRHVREARREAMSDPLTGVQNRRAFDAQLSSGITDAQSEGTPVSLLMLDIDHFKSFNDTHGHQLGDQVLRLVARCLVDCTKGRDTAARYGGEEFAIILPETDITGARAVADQIRETVAGKDIVRKSTGESLGGVTLSGGAAQYIEGETPEQLIERADAALYAAKESGRNRIESAEDPTGLRVVAGNDVA